MKRKRYSVKALKCPKCNSENLPVTATKIEEGENVIRVRYRRCQQCGHTLTTEQVLTQEIIVGRRGRWYGVENLPGPNCKLTDKNVVSILHRLNTGVNVDEVAAEFDVNRSTIGRIKSGKAWKHLSIVPEMEK